MAFRRLLAGVGRNTGMRNARELERCGDSFGNLCLGVMSTEKSPLDVEVIKT